MELDTLKTAWNTVERPIKSAEEIQKMLKENNHPVLKGIRRQLLIEVICWTLFLLWYYTMFDGDQKPLFINIVLVICVGIALVHNFIGYGLSKYLITGTSVVISLEHYLKRVKLYALTSIFLRVLLMSGFLLFFMYNIIFNSAKYLSLSVVLVLFSIQLILLGRIWMLRLKKLKRTLASFL